MLEGNVADGIFNPSIVRLRMLPMVRGTRTVSESALKAPSRALVLTETNKGGSLDNVDQCNIAWSPVGLFISVTSLPSAYTK